MKISKIFKNGIVDENPIFVQVIGMCPTLAVTTSAINGLGMGLATTFVLTCANFVISSIKSIVPAQVRIPCYLVVIASFVTIVQLLLKAYVPSLDSALGIFIPLIIVNCLVLARAESFASKNSPILSIFDGLAMGAGFTIALVIIGAIREFLGNGSIFDIMILPEVFPRTIAMILAPGAFFTLAFLIALINYMKARSK